MSRRHLSLGAHPVAALLAASASGCWLVWGIEPLSEETGTGGASATATTTQTTSTAGSPGSGGAPQGGGGDGGGGGGEGGAPPAVGCTPTAGMDGSFKLLSVCHGYAPRRIVAAEDRLAVTGDFGGMPGVAFVTLFDLSGNDTATLPMTNVFETSVHAYTTARNEKRIVVGGNYEADEIPAFAMQQGTACSGYQCGFIAVLDYGLETVWPVEWLDPGATGELEVNGVDVAKVQVQQYQGRHFLSIAGGFRGQLAPFDAATFMDAPPPLRSYVITVDVEGDAPTGEADMWGATQARTLESAIHPVDVEELRVTAVGVEDAFATVHTLETENNLAYSPPDNLGENVDITRAGSGFRILRASNSQLFIHEYGWTAQTNEVIATLPFAEGRAAGNEAGHLFIGGGYALPITIGETLPNVGDGSTRDMLLVHMDPAQNLTPHVLAESSPDDATIADVAVSPSSRTFFVASFHGELYFGGQTFTAAPEGSMLVGELVD